MKKLIATSFLLAGLTAFPLFAEDAHHREEGNKPADASAGAQTKQADAQKNQMQEHMNNMREQMDRIHNTADPKERQKLVRQHMQTMHDQMIR